MQSIKHTPEHIAIMREQLKALNLPKQRPFTSFEKKWIEKNKSAELKNDPLNKKIDD